jgi:hypothetical protein
MGGQHRQKTETMKPKSLPLKPVIKQHIKSFFSLYRKGDTFKTESIIKYCKGHMGIKAIYGDTILRYARELREEGAIDYVIKCRQSRVVEVI